MVTSDTSDRQTLVEHYKRGVGYLRIHSRRSSEFQKGHRKCAQLHSLGANKVEVVGAVGGVQHELSDATSRSSDQDLSMFIPVVHFVEKPEGILVERLPSCIWGQVANSLLGRWTEELDAVVTKLDRGILNGELGNVFLLRRQQGIWQRQGKDHVIEAVPEALECVPDDKGDFIRKRLELFCDRVNAPFAIGLLKDSIAIARPVSHKCFDVFDVAISTGEFVPVAGHHRADES